MAGFLRSSLFRVAVLAGVGLVVSAGPSCSTGNYPAVSPDGVREEAGHALACDPALIKFEQEPPGYEEYRVRGCGRTASLLCVEDRAGVRCRTSDVSNGDRIASEGTGGGDVDTSDYDTDGCGCGHLFGGKHKSNDPSTPNNPTSTTPQRTKR